MSPRLGRSIWIAKRLKDCMRWDVAIQTITAKNAVESIGSSAVARAGHTRVRCIPTGLEACVTSAKRLECLSFSSNGAPMNRESKSGETTRNALAAYSMAVNGASSRHEHFSRHPQRPAICFSHLGVGRRGDLVEVAAVSKIRNAVRLPAKRSKYRAVRTTVDGITFASKKEAARYSELKRLEKVGVIGGLLLQPEWELRVDRQHICTYRADFEYDEIYRTGVRHVIEDVKGVRTPAYVIKKKLMRALYGIEIKEV